MPDFFLVKDIHDVITHAKFGDDRLTGLGVVAGQISAFPIDFAGRPYNTLTLPCERVMWSDGHRIYGLKRSPFCGYNTTYSVELVGEDSLRYSNEIESTDLRYNVPMSLTD